MAARQGPAPGREEKRTPGKLGPGRASHPISQLHDDRQLWEETSCCQVREYLRLRCRCHGSRMWAHVGRWGRGRVARGADIWLTWRAHSVSVRCNFLISRKNEKYFAEKEEIWDRVAVQCFLQFSSLSSPPHFSTLKIKSGHLIFDWAWHISSWFGESRKKLWTSNFRVLNSSLWPQNSLQSDKDINSEVIILTSNKFPSHRMLSPFDSYSRFD